MGLFRSVLVADDEPSLRHVMCLVLAEQGYEVRVVGSGEEALRELKQRAYDVLLTDVRMSRLDGLQLLKESLAVHPELTVLVMSAYGSKVQALEAVRSGAYDYLQKPFKPEELVFTLKKAEERQRLVTENRRLRRAADGNGTEPLSQLVGQSEPMQALKRQIARVAPVTSTVLISGETGTGKELIARALHDLSSRASLPFVTVNCGAIPEGLIESELFGHAKGAFTDARSAKRGLFSEADGGTLFLDEVGELPAAAQVKLLRVLQAGEVRPVGDTRSERVDVRVVAASLRDLGKQVERGQFREDLFFRLNVVTLSAPPLRSRGGDLMILAQTFLQRFNRRFCREPAITGFAEEAVAVLSAYPWPGNVRELENAIERAVLMADRDVILAENLPERVWALPVVPNDAIDAVDNLSLKRGIAALEERLIRAALKRTKGNRTRAAELLELSGRALLYKIKDYGIDPDSEI